MTKKNGKVEKREIHCLPRNFFPSNQLFSGTVWKSYEKRDHDEIFSVKSHSKNLLKQLLQMYVFTILRGIFLTDDPNIFCRIGSKVKIIKVIFSKCQFQIWAISHQKLVIFRCLFVNVSTPIRFFNLKWKFGPSSIEINWNFWPKFAQQLIISISILVIY